MNRAQTIKEAKRIVIKIGSSSLMHDTGKINLGKIDLLARHLTDLKNSGKDVVLVSSGAIAVGCDHLGIPRPTKVEDKQAVAAVGQAVLMQIYRRFFAEYNQSVAQILLTKDVFDSEEREKNAHNTFESLFSLGVIPIVNENDTVSTDEIEFGDNDTLSAIVTELIHGDVLVLLSDVDGLYTANPRECAEAEIIKVVSEINEHIISIAGGAGTSVGTGGMATKINAAKIALESGFAMIISNAKDLSNIAKIFAGEEVGTLFYSQNAID